MSHVLQRILSELILPPFGPFLLLLAAMIIAQRWRRTGFAIAAVAVAMQFGISLAVLHNRIHAPWPDVPEAIAPPYPPADAIVVLGGGRYLDAPEYGGDTAGPSTLERVRYAAKLHRETGKPILVSGGRPGGVGNRAEAEIMRDILENEFLVPVAWVEPESEETAQNASFSSRLLASAGVQSIYLVTHGQHIERASAAFQSHGIEVIPMVTGFLRPAPENLFSWLPTFGGMALNRYWVYERLAALKPGG